MLPETAYRVETVTYDDDTMETFYYQEHIDYAVGIGFVEVSYTVSDYVYPENFSPESMIFRLQLIY